MKSLANKNRGRIASPRTPSTTMDPTRSLLFWLSLVAIVTMAQFAFFSNTRTLTMIQDASTAHDDAPRLTPQPFTLVSTKAKQPKVEPFRIDPFYQELHNKIDSVSPEERCAAFGVEPHKEPSPRRIFFGSMLADESMDVLKMNAIETHGIYHSMAFVESNTTHMATPRTMRFKDTPEADMLLYSKMFGNNTQVTIDYWMEDIPDLVEMNREVEQRKTIVKIWQEAGMTERDIGLMADLDEIVSRDFLRALQVCDFPKLRYQEEQPSCQTPKMVLSTIQFESSPYCIKNYEWFHPDLLLGQCIEGIGDPSERVIPLRNYLRKFGQRSDTYGFNDYNRYPKHVVESNKFPLWSGRDIRGVSGTEEPLTNYKKTPGHGKTSAYGVAYHLHNWFSDIEVVRHKYATYGHGWEDALKVKLSTIQEDLDLLVRCARDISNEANPKGYPYYEHNDGDLNTFWKNLGGPRPLYFLNETYIHERHALLQSMVARDEGKYGTVYPSSSS